MPTRVLIGLAVLTTVVSIALWQAHGAETLTKIKVAVEVEPDALLAATGLFDGEMGRKDVEWHDEYRFGLLPSGSAPRETLSVISVSGLAWAFALGTLIVLRLRGRRAAHTQSSKVQESMS